MNLKEKFEFFVDTNLIKFKFYNVLRKRLSALNIVSSFCSTFASFIMLVIFTIFGVLYESAWYYTLGGFYFLFFVIKLLILFLMYINIVKYNDKTGVFTKKVSQTQLFSSIYFILIALCFGSILFVAINRGLTNIKSTIPAITSATYIFVKVISTIISYKFVSKKQNYTFKNFKNVSLMEALFSILILEVNMIYTFGTLNSSMNALLYISTIVFSLLAIIFSIYIIIKSIQNLKK